MSNSKKMRQIYINAKSIDDKLEDKVVDKVSLYNGRYDSEKQFLMTFKDGSYIAITMERREPDDEYVLCNDYIPRLSEYYNGPSGYLNEKGKFVLDESIRRLDLVLLSIMKL